MTMFDNTKASKSDNVKIIPHLWLNCNIKMQKEGGKMKFGNKNKKEICRVLTAAVFVVLTLIWTGFIFGNSLRDAEKSTQQSDKVQQVVNQVLDQAGLDVTVESESVRNGAHFFEFAVLAVLVSLDIIFIYAAPRISRRAYLHKKGLLVLCITLPVCSLLAVIDELLQLTSEGRSCDIRDVAVDSLGVLMGFCIAALIFTVVYMLVRHARGASEPISSEFPKSSDDSI